jgi:hypothetical protein
MGMATVSDREKSSCRARDYEGRIRVDHKPAQGVHDGKEILTCAWCGATLRD